MKIKKLSFGSHYYYAAFRPYRRSLFVSELGKPITLGSAGSRLLEHQKLFYSKKMKNFSWINPLDTLMKDPQRSIYRTGLMLNNSLVQNQKTEFVTSDGSRRLTWYICGPTVYDISHLGHARTYIGFDIIRRILESYFGYEVRYCMNITDIDDKIIKRASEQGLNFLEFTRKYEGLFFEDMRRLNVLYPTYITRVSEYVPEVIKFIERLIENGFAYASNGSVYFDIESFTKAGHQYAKLDPTKIKEAKQEDVDGELSKDNTEDKKNKGDFALWKKSKENEPSWESPFGRGRPGWHIECSAMSAEVFGATLDIHSGGCDLKFPHHDNEIAQTEGYYKIPQWINYFLHTGHLNIDGLKMSKSLKNFLKIKDVLDSYNANTFRLLFMSHKWDTGMNYTEDGLDAAYTLDKYFKEFFANVKQWVSTDDMKNDLKFDEKENSLVRLLEDRKEEIRKALCDNFNTELALKHLKDLIKALYEYQSTKGITFKIHLAYSYAKYIASMAKCFGLVYSTEFVEYFQFDEANVKQNQESIAKPYVEAICMFRNKIKDLAGQKDFKGIFEVSDLLRDEVLPNLGVKLEDGSKGSEELKYRIMDRDELLKEIAIAKELKRKQQEKKLKEKEEKELKLKTPAREWYALKTDLYSKFDDMGIPTHDVKGNELKKEERNALVKEFNSHQKKHLKFLEDQKNKAEK